MEQEDSIDIDKELDFKLAELIIRERGGIMRNHHGQESESGGQMDR